MQHLKLITDELKIVPRLVCEVGVGESKESSQVREFIEAGASAILIEALPRFCQKLAADFAAYPRVRIVNCAILDRNGSVTIYDRALSTFVEGIESPSIVNDRYTPNLSDAVVVPARTFEHFDEGNIDLLAIDAEGCEYYVLAGLQSRPALICLEATGMAEWGHTYVNPKLREIRDWMERNRYIQVAKVGPDTLFLSDPILNRQVLPSSST